MKIKTNKTNNNRKTNKTNKKRKTHKKTRALRKSNKLRGGQVGALIPEAERGLILNRLQYLVRNSSSRALLCEDVQSLIPAFQNTPDVPVKLPKPVAIMGNGAKQYIIGTESYFVTTAEEAGPLIKRLQAESAAIWSERSRITCATLLLLGIISSKLQRASQPFIIVAKGGLGVALATSQLPGDTELVSVSDLDFKVVKNPKVVSGKYDPMAGLSLSLHICYTIQWFLQQIVSEGYSISVLDPSTRGKVGGYQDMVKISLRAPNKILFPFLDMDFGDYEKNKHYLDNLSEISGSVPIGGGTQMPVSFLFQNVKLMLTEKLYFFAQYLFLRDQLANPSYINALKSMRNNTPFGTLAYDPHTGAITFNDEPVTVERCDWFLEKFQRAIHLLTNIIVEADDTAIHGLASKQNQVFYSTPPQLPQDLRIRVVQSLYPAA
jgi:hypothetical protein